MNNNNRVDEININNNNAIEQAPMFGSVRNE